MDEFEREYYLQLFKIKIYELNGQSFEDFFCNIMKANDDSFQKVKAYGNRGDYSCDGLNLNTDDYYLCYSPEDINKKSTQTNAKEKITNDLNGIVSKWPGIKNIHYVVNDSFRGLSAPILQIIKDLKSTLSVSIDVFSMNRLMDIFINLSKEKIQGIVGYCPNFEPKEAAVETLDFRIISEIVKYIDENTADMIFDDNLIAPDFDEKIEFNKLSETIARKLKESHVYVTRVEQFFDEFTNYNKDTLRNKLIFIYKKACETILNDHDGYADERFYYLFDKICYKKESKTVVENCIVILVTFFESCDIFEEPVHA